MTEPLDPLQRSPRTDHSRRLALGMEIEDFAFEAAVSVDELKAYEDTELDAEFDPEVAARVGAALERLEANPPERPPALA